MVLYIFNTTGSLLRAIPFLFYVSLASLILSSCQMEIGGKKDKDDDEEKVLPPVIVYLVYKSNISNNIKLSSTVLPAKVVKVYPRSIGMVDQLLAEEGQPVIRNQVLAHLDNTDQKLAVERANSKLTRAKYDLDRAVEMNENNLLSENELRQFQLIYREDEISLAQAQITLERTIIKAPFAGIITERQIEIGDKVDPSRQLFTVVDQGSLKLDVWVNEDVAQIMQVGMRAKVIPFSSSLMNEVEATLVRLNPVIDPQYGKRKATFELNSETQLLKPGQFVDVNLTLETHLDVIVIPKRAIVHQAGSSVVFVCNDSIAVRKTVLTDIEAGDNIEILQGIQVGDRIIVEGQFTLKDSTTVNVISTNQ